MASDPAASSSQSEAESAARSRILGAAFGLFMEKGYAGVSTLEIATRAKVSKRDLYALVGNKQEIFRSCVATRARRMTALYESPPPTTKAALADALKHLGGALLQELLHPAVVAVNRLAIASPTAASPELAAEIARVRKANIAAIARFLAAAQAGGLIGPGDTGAMAELYLDLLGGPRLMLHALAAGETPTEAETNARAATAAETFLRLHGA
jgi:AcrR family transcriptional regulator